MKRGFALIVLATALSLAASAEEKGPTVTVTERSKGTSKIPLPVDLRDFTPEQRRQLLPLLIPDRSELRANRGNSTTIEFTIYNKEPNEDGTKTRPGEPPLAQGRYGGPQLSGYATCSPHNVHNPHISTVNPAGYVKVKANATCKFTHTGPGAAPPWVAWDYALVLRIKPDSLGHWMPDNSDQFSKQGYQVTFYPNKQGSTPGTQVSSAFGCVDGHYVGEGAIFIILPTGWYVGNNEIGYAESNEVHIDC